MSGHSAESDAPREAVPGEVVHDRGSAPDTGWFIVARGGYFDVDNAVWCRNQDDDTPWTTEWFDLYGTVADLIVGHVLPPEGSAR